MTKAASGCLSALWTPCGWPCRLRARSNCLCGFFGPPFPERPSIRAARPIRRSNVFTFFSLYIKTGSDGCLWITGQPPICLSTQPVTPFPACALAMFGGVRQIGQLFVSTQIPGLFPSDPHALHNRLQRRYSQAGRRRPPRNLLQAAAFRFRRASRRVPGGTGADTAGAPLQRLCAVVTPRAMNRRHLDLGSPGDRARSPCGPLLTSALLRGLKIVRVWDRRHMRREGLRRKSTDNRRCADFKFPSIRPARGRCGLVLSPLFLWESPPDSPIVPVAHPSARRNLCFHIFFSI